MPKRNRAKEAARAERRQADQATRASKRRTRPKKKGARSRPDPSDVPDAEVRFVGGIDAVKEYTCPSCLRTIPVGLGHIVAVPPEDPDLRRHWHRGCWDNRENLR